MESTPQFGRYRPVYQLGDGGAARVWAGFVSGVHAPFALKYLRGDLRNNHLYVQRFAREAQIGFAVSGEHPNIVTVRAFDPDAGGTPLLVLDLVGPPLSAVKDRLVGDASAIRWIASEALRALAHIHSCGVIHRDISPGNLLIAPNGRVRLNDFGNATRYDDGFGTDGVVGGTVPYVSPELLRGDHGTPASDLFSLGAVLFELWTGEPPFGTSLEDVVEGHARGRLELPNTMPRDLRALILGLLVLNEVRRLREPEAASFLRWRARGAPARAAAGIGDLGLQWLSTRCPTFVGKLTYQRAYLVGGDLRRGARRPWDVVTPSLAVAAVTAACAGLWVVLDARTDGNEGVIERAEQKRNSPTPGQLAAVEAIREPDPADPGVSLVGAGLAERDRGDSPSLVAYDPSSEPATTLRVGARKWLSRSVNRAPRFDASEKREPVEPHSPPLQDAPRRGASDRETAKAFEATESLLDRIPLADAQLGNAYVGAYSAKLRAGEARIELRIKGDFVIGGLVVRHERGMTAAHLEGQSVVFGAGEWLRGATVAIVITEKGTDRLVVLRGVKIN